VPPSQGKLMLDSIPDTRRGKREHALLAFDFAGAFRRSELGRVVI